MWYRPEVFVKQLDTEVLLKEYRNPEQFGDACRQCPDYDNNWSCPPGIPDPFSYLEGYEKVFVVAVKVNYTEEVTGEDVKKEDAAIWRASSYEKVKKRLFATLLANEKKGSGGKCMGAGKCLLCRKCTREDSKPCRYPDLRRYSFTSFGFDFSRMLKDFFDLEMIWCGGEEIPPYDIAVAALFCRP